MTYIVSTLIQLARTSYILTTRFHKGNLEIQPLDIQLPSSNNSVLWREKHDIFVDRWPSLPLITMQVWALRQSQHVSHLLSVVLEIGKIWGDSWYWNVEVAVKEKCSLYYQRSSKTSPTYHHPHQHSPPSFLCLQSDIEEHGTSSCYLSTFSQRNTKVKDRKMTDVKRPCG